MTNGQGYTMKKEQQWLTYNLYFNSHPDILIYTPKKGNLVMMIWLKQVVLQKVMWLKQVVLYCEKNGFIVEPEYLGSNKTSVAKLHAKPSQRGSWLCIANLMANVSPEPSSIQGTAAQLLSVANPAPSPR